MCVCGCVRGYVCGVCVCGVCVVWVSVDMCIDVGVRVGVSVG